MFHVIYKTTNSKNGKFYIGAHTTACVDDGYLGSGKYLKRAVKQYGHESFVREILYVFASKEEMFAKEAEIVNSEFVKCDSNYNLKLGGSGGNPGIIGAFRGQKHTEATKVKMRLKRANQVITEDAKHKVSVNNGMKRPEIASKVSRSLTGRKQSDEHVKAVSQAISGLRKVNNGIINRAVKQDEADRLVSEGWQYGILRKNK